MPPEDALASGTDQLVLSNLGQLRYNTDRLDHQGLGQFALAIPLTITVLLFDHIARRNT